MSQDMRVRVPPSVQSLQVGRCVARREGSAKGIPLEEPPSVLFSLSSLPHAFRSSD